MKNKTKSIALSGVFVAIYAVVTLAISPFSFGAIQCRLSDVLLMFCIKRKEAIAGCVFGCVIANMFSPLGIIDMAVGALANFLIGAFAYKSKKIIMTIVAGGMIAGLFIGAELCVIYSIPFLMTFVTVAIGEILSLTVGAILYRIINKHMGERQIENVK